jgi:hypothetical protein
MILNQDGLGSAEAGWATLFYIVHWLISWAVFALQLETLALAAMHHSLQGRKPFNSAFRATALVLVPSFLMTIVIPLAWNLAQWFGFAGYFVSQLISDVALAAVFLALLSRAKRKLGLSSNLLNP